MDNCIFCKISRNEIVSQRLVDSDWAFAIRDVHPIAKEHILFIARDHFQDMTKVPDWLFDHVMTMSRKYGKEHLPNGFRIVINTGDEAGQTVKHFHVHVLGGEKLKDL